MAVIGLRERAALALAALLAVATPAVLLTPSKAPSVPATPPERPPPIAVRQPPPLRAAYARPLFGASDSPAPADAPELLGIAGRLNRDAEAMVRGSDSITRSLKPGDRIDGWRLESLAMDAAFFTRGAQRVRVAVPAAGDQ